MNPNHRKWSTGEERELVYSISIGKTFSQIAPFFGRTNSALQNKFGRMMGFLAQEQYNWPHNWREMAKEKLENF